MIAKIDLSALEAEGRFHKNQPDCPNMSADQMKAFMDYIPKDVVIPKLNEAVEKLNKFEDEPIRYGTQDNWKYIIYPNGEGVCYTTLSHFCQTPRRIGEFYASQPIEIAPPYDFFISDTSAQVTVSGGEQDEAYIVNTLSVTPQKLEFMILKIGGMSESAYCDITVTLRGRCC